MGIFETIKEQAQQLLSLGKFSKKELATDYNSCVNLNLENIGTAPFIDTVTLSIYLGSQPQELTEMASDRCDSMYKTFFIDKKTHAIVPYNYPGKLREINAPVAELKEMQKKLAAAFSKFPIHPANNGFVEGKNIVDAVNAVKDGETLIHVDLNKFFDNHKSDYVTEKLRKIYAETYKVELPDDTLKTLTTLLTRRGKLPQGAPSSPCLVVALNYEMDTAITELANKYKLSYSRYADDLAFSGEIEYKEAKRFIKELTQIIKPFTINWEKLKIMRTKSKRILKFIEFSGIQFKNKNLKSILTATAELFGDLSFQQTKTGTYIVTSERMSELTKEQVEENLTKLKEALVAIKDLAITPNYYYIQSTKHLLGMNIVDGKVNYPRKDYENLRLIAMLLGRQQMFRDMKDALDVADSKYSVFTDYQKESQIEYLINGMELFSEMFALNKEFHRNLFHDPLDLNHFMGIISHINLVDPTKAVKLKQIIHKSYDNCYNQFLEFMKTFDNSGLVIPIINRIKTGAFKY